MKNKSWFSIEKNITKWKTAPYYNYDKLLSSWKKFFFFQKIVVFLLSLGLGEWTRWDFQARIVIQKVGVTFLFYAWVWEVRYVDYVSIHPRVLEMFWGEDLKNVKGKFFLNLRFGLNSAWGSSSIHYDNHGHNILIIFDVLSNFPVTTIEMKPN